MKGRGVQQDLLHRAAGMDGEELRYTLAEEVAKEELCESLEEDFVINKNLPEYLVEKIVAMVPFPWICTARGLSKSWLSRFSSISSQDDEGNKVRAASFQKKVDEWSKNWDTFCPFFFSQNMSVAYNGASHVWQKMPSLSFLPTSLLSRCTMQIEGGLVYLFSRAPRFGEYEVYVANILTRSWKQLPPPPYTGNSVFCHKFVKLASLEMYKVIVLSMHPLNDESGMMSCSAQIYDAKSDTWTCKEYVVSHEFEVVRSSYLDGVLYMVGLNAQRVLAFNLEELVFEDFRLEIESPDLVSGHLRLVVCNRDLVMIVSKSGSTLVNLDGLKLFKSRSKCKSGNDTPSMRVLKIDFGSFRVSQLAEGPPTALDARTIRALEPVSDGKSIYFGLTECGTRVLAYNLATDEWSCIPVHIPDTGTNHKLIGSSIQQPGKPSAINAENFQDVLWRGDLFSSTMSDLEQIMLNNSIPGSPHLLY